jgi:hexokinase
MKQVAIPRQVYTGSCTQLFDFLATQLADFIREQEQRHKARAALCCAVPCVGHMLLAVPCMHQQLVAGPVEV